MKELSKNMLHIIGGGVASWANNTITVTDQSTFQMNGFKALANCVIDLATNTVLYDGTQDSFCFKGTQYNVTSVPGGHSYTPANKC